MAGTVLNGWPCTGIGKTIPVNHAENKRYIHRKLCGDYGDTAPEFLDCLSSTIEDILAGVLKKARYWEWLATKPLNERQRLLINKLLDGFEGKLTTSKWAKIAKCSQDTALRDIQQLVEQDVLVRENAGGRSTSYALAKLGTNAESNALFVSRD